MNPDSELLRHLTEETDFANAPAYAGSIEWQRDDGGPLGLALLLQFVPNQGDAWSYTLDSIDRSFSNALAMKSKLDKLPELPASVAPLEPAPSLGMFVTSSGRSIRSWSACWAGGRANSIWP